MSKNMEPIEKLADYCGDGNPVIVQEFTAGRGWVRQTYRKRASYSWLRKLRSQGVTSIAVEVEPGRVADFTIAELLRGSRQPLLSGNLI